MPISYIKYGSTSYQIDDKEKLPLAGGTMTGTIYRTISTTAENTPMLSLASNNLDTWIWRVKDKATGSYTAVSSVYGFGLKYIGTGSGLTNSLSLIADNLTGTAVTAININQAGQIGIGTTANSSYRAYINGNAYLNGTLSITDKIYANEFHHNSHDNNDSILLAGGGYTSLTSFQTSLTSTKVGDTYQPIYWTGTGFSTVNFTAGASSVGEHNANNIKSNGVWYWTTNGPSTSIGMSATDGALFSQAYNTSWVAQIAQDYRNGGLYVRGLNNSTWSDWKTVLDTRNTVITNTESTASSGSNVLSINVGGNTSTVYYMKPITFTIGNSGKYVSGTTNISWTLDQIGAQPAGPYVKYEDRTISSNQVDNIVTDFPKIVFGTGIPYDIIGNSSKNGVIFDIPFYTGAERLQAAQLSINVSEKENVEPNLYFRNTNGEGTLGKWNKVYHNSNLIFFTGSNTENTWGQKLSIVADGVTSTIVTPPEPTYEGIYHINGTGSSTGVWKGSHTGITAYYDGLTILYIPDKAGASTTTLEINTLGAATCYISNSGKITTHYGVGTPVLLTYKNNNSTVGWKRADYSANSDSKIYLYRQNTVSGTYDDFFPLVVSRTLLSGITTTDSKYTSVYGVVGPNDKHPEVNPVNGQVYFKGDLFLDGQIYSNNISLTGTLTNTNSSNDTLILSITGISPMPTQ